MFQVENHPYLTQNKLKEICESNGILLTAYGPLGSPYRGANSKGLVLLDEPIVKQIADKHKKTSAQVLLRFQVMITEFFFQNRITDLYPFFILQL